MRIWLAGTAMGVIATMLWFATNGSETAGPEAAGAITVPSGQEVTALDVIRSAPGTEGLTLRFRFLAPAIGREDGGISAESAQADMAWLCETYALPRLPEIGPAPAQIVISLADRPVPFGEVAPEATQFFEAFSRDGDRCVWEAF
ncbi:DUF6497 family protein [Defluviimonas salinarum]|uniref:DUF6497 family protein n=1 Tax=Defluviimonas salinarum TaxID=2992147 RepID=A0ABT3J0W7_9RHOB|nr:DUF6497 family protein [Defluviimonas salinarum]